MKTALKGFINAQRVFFYKYAKGQIYSFIETLKSEWKTDTAIHEVGAPVI